MPCPAGIYMLIHASTVTQWLSNGVPGILGDWGGIFQGIGGGWGGQGEWEVRLSCPPQLISGDSKNFTNKVRDTVKWDENHTNIENKAPDNISSGIFLW